jgi:hypothetical protein
MSTPKDFNAWTQHTAQLLRERRWDEVDMEQLIEEVEDLGRSERNSIKSQLSRLLLHMLKWQYQPQRRSDSWLDSLNDARTQIEDKIEDSPSLQGYPAEQLHAAYARARRRAASQTRLPLSTFPAECPYVLDDLLHEDFLPDAVS